MQRLLFLCLALTIMACGNQEAETTVSNPVEASDPAANPSEVLSPPEALGEEIPAGNLSSPFPPSEHLSSPPPPPPAPSTVNAPEVIINQEAPAPPPPPAVEQEIPKPPVVIEEEVPAPPRPPADPAIAATEAWGSLLSKTVSNNGKVNYAGIKAELATLDNFLETTASGPPSGSLAARAYWINQYNAYTIKLILDNWPVSSIMDLHGGKPWDVKWIEIGGQNLSLNQIEFEKLRPANTDARIHFAVNCAAASCPPLHNRLFTAANLNSKLATLARQFVNNQQHNDFSITPWQLSSIFDWYGNDFSDLNAFLQEYSNENLADDAPAPSFKEYDWGLNN